MDRWIHEEVDRVLLANSLTKRKNLRNSCNKVASNGWEVTIMITWMVRISQSSLTQGCVMQKTLTLRIQVTSEREVKWIFLLLSSFICYTVRKFKGLQRSNIWLWSKRFCTFLDLILGQNIPSVKHDKVERSKWLLRSFRVQCLALF